MAKFGLKLRTTLTLLAILALALSLQSCILLFIGLRASIRDDVMWARQYLKNEVSTVDVPNQQMESFPSAAESGDFFHTRRDQFSCIFIEIDGETKVVSSPCRFQNDLIAKSRTAEGTKKPVIGFAGDGWKSYFFIGDTALLSVPLLTAAGEVYGSINAERSLSHVYSRFQKETIVALCYLVVNVIIFGTLGFLRFSRLFFRPLEKLVTVAENYRPDNQSLMALSDGQSDFRKLSISLHDLLDRVERDNRRLRKTVDELEEANREMKEKNELVIRSERLASTGRLSAGLAHEIGNPLSIVQGYVELLGRDDLSSAEKTKFSQSAQKELDRIKSLIRQLLDFSRPLPPANEIVGANALISEVLSFVSVEKSFADYRIRTDFQAERDELLIDRNALRQVLINVLLNAVDATAEKKEGKEISITTSNPGGKEGMGSVFSISIEDNGVGIAKDNLGHVFDPFYTTKEAGRGTGLGLFVCHTIIERMGGSIEIFNRPAAGVEVKIELPLNEKKHRRKYGPTVYDIADDT